MTTDVERKQVLDRLTRYVSDHISEIPSDARVTAGKLQKWIEPRRTSHPTDYNSVRAVWRRLEAQLTGTISAAPTTPATHLPASAFAPVSVAAVSTATEAPAQVDLNASGPTAPAPAAPIDITPVMPPAPAPAPLYRPYSPKVSEGQARQRASYGK